MNKQSICPNCRIRINIAPHLQNAEYIRCLNCNQDIQNPLLFNNSGGNYEDKEKLKDDILKNSMYATIGLGFFFPPIWIASVILFFMRILRK